jgi:hypothetical protein
MRCRAHHVVNHWGKRGAKEEKKKRRGRRREYSEAIFVILVGMKVLSGKSNNGRGGLPARRDVSHSPYKELQRALKL